MNGSSHTGDYDVMKSQNESESEGEKEQDTFS